MALSRHSINKLFEAHGWHYFASKPDMFIPVARAIEAETRKADTELIRQMLDALVIAYQTLNTEGLRSSVMQAIGSAKARLEQS